MDISEERRGAVVVIKPHGPLSQDDATDFKSRVDAVMQRTLGRFVVDLAAVPYSDSIGLENLVDISDQLSQSGRVLKLCGCNETLRDVFNLTDISMLFEHYEDANDAVRSFL